MSEITILPRSRIVHVQFEVNLPADASHEEVLEWINSEVGNGGICLRNPLSRFGMEAIGEPTLTDTQTHLHEEPTVYANGGGTIRRWRERHPFTGPPAMEVLVGSVSFERSEGAT